MASTINMTTLPLEIRERFWNCMAWNDYIPHSPTAKQLCFLMLPHKEALYGGAAGGGKSDALLMGALQYVEYPRYSAIIFRKKLTDLELEGCLIPRSHQWLGGTDAKWNGSLHKWTFPSGAVLQFGYLDKLTDRYRYMSAEFQYIAVDELTQHFEDDYTYLFSRLRKSHCPFHPYPEFNNACQTCREFSALATIPLRVRTASNPGGVGHAWVQKRYKIKRVGNIYRGTDPSRPHVPAFIVDNPFLNQEEYSEALQNLDPITREQLLRGDWGVAPDSRFRKPWAKYYKVNDTQDYIFLPNRPSEATGRGFYVTRCPVFQTVDVAASVREGPADELLWRKQPSWSVISTWLVTDTWDLLLWHVDRFQAETPEVLHRIRHGFKSRLGRGEQGIHFPINQPMFVGIEANGLGIGIFQQLAREGFPVRDLKPGSVDKLVRATDAANRMEQGRIWFPEHNPPWLEAFESEIFTWTGDPVQNDDQIDCLAYAAMAVTELATERGSSVFGGSDKEFLPTVHK